MANSSRDGLKKAGGELRKELKSGISDIIKEETASIKEDVAAEIRKEMSGIGDTVAEAVSDSATTQVPKIKKAGKKAGEKLAAATNGGLQEGIKEGTRKRGRMSNAQLSAIDVSGITKDFDVALASLDKELDKKQKETTREIKKLKAKKDKIMESIDSALSNAREKDKTRNGGRLTNGIEYLQKDVDHYVSIAQKNSDEKYTKAQIKALETQYKLVTKLEELKKRVKVSGDTVSDKSKTSEGAVTGYIKDLYQMKALLDEINSSAKKYNIPALNMEDYLDGFDSFERKILRMTDDAKNVLEASLTEPITAAKDEVLSLQSEIRKIYNSAKNGAILEAGGDTEGSVAQLVKTKEAAKEAAKEILVTREELEKLESVRSRLDKKGASKKPFRANADRDEFVRLSAMDMSAKGITLDTILGKSTLSGSETVLINLLQNTPELMRNFNDIQNSIVKVMTTIDNLVPAGVTAPQPPAAAPIDASRVEELTEEQKLLQTNIQYYKELVEVAKRASEIRKSGNVTDYDGNDWKYSKEMLYGYSDKLFKFTQETLYPDLPERIGKTVEEIREARIQLKAEFVALFECIEDFFEGRFRNKNQIKGITLLQHDSILDELNKLFGADKVSITSGFYDLDKIDTDSVINKFLGISSSAQPEVNQSALDSSTSQEVDSQNELQSELQETEKQAKKVAKSFEEVKMAIDKIDASKYSLNELAARRSYAGADELPQLQKLGIADDQGNKVATLDESGMTSNYGVLLTESFAILIRRTETENEQLDVLISKINQAKALGIQTAQILGEFSTGKGTYQIQERAAGSPLFYNGEIDEKRVNILEAQNNALAVQDEHIKKLISDIIILDNMGIELDYGNSANFPYDPEKGFSFIDMGLKDANKEAIDTLRLVKAISTIMASNTANQGGIFNPEYIENTIKLLAKVKTAFLDVGISSAEIDKTFLSLGENIRPEMLPKVNMLINPDDIIPEEAIERFLNLKEEIISCSDKIRDLKSDMRIYGLDESGDKTSSMNDVLLKGVIGRSTGLDAAAKHESLFGEIEGENLTKLLNTLEMTEEAYRRIVDEKKKNFKLNSEFQKEIALEEERLGLLREELKIQASNISNRVFDSKKYKLSSPKLTSAKFSQSTTPLQSLEPVEEKAPTSSPTSAGNQIPGQITMDAYLAETAQASEVATDEIVEDQKKVETAVKNATNAVEEQTKAVSESSKAWTKTDVEEFMEARKNAINESVAREDTSKAKYIIDYDEIDGRLNSASITYFNDELKQTVTEFYGLAAAEEDAFDVLAEGEEQQKKFQLIHTKYTNDEVAASKAKQKALDDLTKKQGKYYADLAKVNSAFANTSEYGDVKTAIENMSADNLEESVSQVETKFSALNQVINTFKQNVKSSASLDPVFSSLLKIEDADNVVEGFKRGFQQYGVSAEDAEKKVKTLADTVERIKNIDVTTPDGIIKLGEEIKNYNDETRALKRETESTKTNYDEYQTQIDIIKQLETETSKLTDLQRQSLSGKTNSAEIADQYNKVEESAKKAEEAIKRVRDMATEGKITDKQASDAETSYMNASDGSTRSQARYVDAFNAATIKEQESAVNDLTNAFKELLSAYSAYGRDSNGQKSLSLGADQEAINAAATALDGYISKARQLGVSEDEITKAQNEFSRSLSSNAAEQGAKTLDGFIAKIDQFEQSLRKSNKLTEFAAVALEEYKKQILSINDSKDLSTPAGVQEYFDNIQKAGAGMSGKLDEINIGNGLFNVSSTLQQLDGLEVKTNRVKSVISSLRAEIDKLSKMRAEGADQSLIREQEVKIIQEADKAFKSLNSETKNMKLVKGTEKSVKDISDLSKAIDKYAYGSLGALKSVGKQVIDENGKITKTYKGMNGEIIKVTAAIHDNTAGMMTNVSTTKGAVGLFGTFGSVLNQFGKYFSFYMTGFSMVTRVFRELRQGLDVLKEYDDSLVTISYTMNVTNEQLNKIGDSAVDTAKKLSASLEDTMDVYKIYANMQTTAKEIEETAKPTLILSNLSGVDASTASDQVQGILNQFNMVEEGGKNLADTSMHIVDVLDKISANVSIDYAKGIKVISDSIQNSGQAAHDAGISYEQLAAISAKVAEKTREDGSSIGNSIKTITTRISKVGKMPGYADEVDNETLSNASASLKAVGIEVYNANGSFRDLDVILGELNDKWDSLTDAQRANIAFNVAATRQTNKFKSIISAWTDSMDLAAEATTASGNSLANNQKYVESYGGKLQQISTQMDTFWLNFYNSDATKGVLDFLIEVTKLLNFVSDGIGGIPTLATLIGGGIGAVSAFRGGGFFESVAKGEGIKGSSIALKSAFTQDDLKYFEDYNSFIKEGASSADAFDASMKNASKSAKRYVKSVQNIGDGTVNMEEVTNGATKGLVKFRLKSLAAAAGIKVLNAMMSVGIMILVQLGIGLLSSAWDKFVNKVDNAREAASEAVDSLTEMKDTLNENESYVKENVAEYEELSRGVDKLGRNVSLTADEFNRYNQITNDLAEMFPDMVTGYTDTGVAILKCKDNVDLLTQSLIDEREAYNNSVKTQASTLLGGFEADTTGHGIIKNDGYSNKDIQNRGMYLQKSEFRISEVDERLVQLLKNAGVSGVGFSDYLFSGTVFDSTEEVQKKINENKAQIDAYINSLSDTMETSAQTNLVPLIDVWLGENKDFTGLPQEVQNSVEQLVTNMGYEFYNSLGGIDGLQEGEAYLVKKWIDDTLTLLTDPTTAEEYQAAVNNLFTLNPNEMTAAEYEEKLNEYLEAISALTGQTVTELKISLGFDDTNIQELLDGVKEKLKNAIGGEEDATLNGWIDGLTVDELKIANSDKFTGAIRRQKQASGEASLTVKDYANTLDYFKQKTDAAVESVRALKEVNESISSLNSIFDKYEKNEGFLTQDEVANILAEKPEYVAYITKVGDQYKLNEQALKDWNAEIKTQQDMIDTQLGGSGYLTGYSNVIDTFMDKRNHGLGSTDGMGEDKFQNDSFAIRNTIGYTHLDSSNLDELLTKNKELNQSLIDGEITTEEWFNSMGSAVSDSGIITALSNVNGQFNETTDYLEETASVLSSQVADALQQSYNKFQQGQIGVKEYVAEFRAGSKVQMDMLQATYALEIGTDGLATAVDESDTAAQSAANSYNNLKNSLDDLGNVSGFIDVLSDAAEWLDDYQDDTKLNIQMGVDWDAAFKDENISSFIGDMTSKLQEFYTQGGEGAVRLRETLMESMNIGAKEASDLLHGSQNDMIDAMQGSQNATAAMTEFIMSETGTTLSNSSQALGGVLSALGDMIENFTYTISFKAPEGIPWSAMITKGGIQLPSFDYTINGSGDGSVTNFAQSLKEAGNYFTTAGNNQANNNTLDLGKYKTNPAGSVASANRPDSKNGGSDKKETEEQFDWIETKIKRLERLITNLGKTASATYQTWSTRNTALGQEMDKVRKQIENQTAAANAYMAAANAVGLSSHYMNLVMNGGLNVESITDDDLKKKIKDFQSFYEKALAAQDAVQDLNDQLANLAKTKFDNVAKNFEGQISLITHRKDMINSFIDQAEKKGMVASKSYYNSLISAENENLSKLKSEYAALNQALAEGMANGGIKQYSEDWYSMVNSINSVSKAMEDANTSLIEYKNNLRQIDWDIFDMTQGYISQITQETDFMLELLDNKDRFDENGKITDIGVTAEGLHAVNYNVYMKQADDYAKEIKKLDAEIAKNPADTALIERRNAMRKAQQDMILAAEKEKTSIKDLVSEGYDKLLEALDKVIAKKKESLAAEKAIFDYEKNVTEQSKKIASYQKQLQAYAGDNSEETQAKVQQIKVALDEAKMTLEETEYNQWLSDQEKMMDTMYSDMQEWVNGRLDNLELIVGDIIEQTNTNAQTISGVLETESANVGYTISYETQKMLDAGKTTDELVAKYGEDFSTKITGVTTAINNIYTVVDTMRKLAEEEAGRKAAELAAQQAAVGSGGGSGSGGSSSLVDTGGGSGSGGGSGNFFIPKKDFYDKSKLNVNTSVVDRLKSLDYDSSFGARAMYYAAMGFGSQSSYTGSASQNNKILQWMKNNGFSEGGGIGDLISRSGEDGFVLAKTGEEILSLDKIAEMQKVFEMMQPFADMTKFNGFVPENTSNMNVTNDINMNITLPNVQNYNDFVNQLQSDTRFEKIVQQMTIGTALGNNSLSKFKY